MAEPKRVSRPEAERELVLAALESELTPRPESGASPQPEVAEESALVLESLER
jgi:hypothetical protein